MDFQIRKAVPGEEKGYREMIIGCLSENPSCGFYEKIGGRLTEENACMIGGREP